MSYKIIYAVFHFLSRSLTQNKEALCALIAEFDLRFDKEQPDYLEAVSALMILLQRILTIDNIPDSM